MNFRSNEQFLEKEELVADMVHHFLIPEIDKSIDREKLRDKQKQHLKNAHNLIYSVLDKLTYKTTCKKYFHPFK